MMLSSVSVGGWITHGTRFYRYIPEMSSYENAVSNCETMEAHVTDIEDYTEKDFILKMV